MVVAPKVPDNPHLLVDGDILAYRAAAAAEKTHYLVTNKDYAIGMYCDSAKATKDYLDGDNTLVWTRKEIKPVETAYLIADSIWGALKEQFGAFTHEVFISWEHNFRDKIWKTKKYKGNRAAEKPKHLKAVLKHLVDNYGARYASGEADDTIVATHYATPNSIIVSNDKDLDQSYGWHYDWVTKELYYVNKRDADLFLFQQILSGDATDNVPGLQGWGPATAREWLEGAQSTADCLARVKEAYKDTEEGYFEEQSELIYIRRDGRSFKEYFGG